MKPEIVRNPVPYTPVRHSWYHFSCFHQMLGYALLRDTPWALDYIACREAVGRLEATEDYPFFQLNRPDEPDPFLSWDGGWHVDPERLRGALTERAAVLALRDLYDVAGFRHFGRRHHPNWYLLTGFDRRRRTFYAFAEVGGKDAQFDARCYQECELTEAEVVFTGQRAQRVFPEVMGIHPHFPVLVATGRLPSRAVFEQERKLETAWRESDDPQEVLARAIGRVELFAGELNAESLLREQVEFSRWGRQLRALQVLSARRERYRVFGDAAASAMLCIDRLLASSLFWEGQIRAGRLDRRRLVKRQQFVATNLRELQAINTRISRTRFRPADSQPDA